MIIRLKSVDDKMKYWDKVNVDLKMPQRHGTAVQTVANHVM